MILNNIIYLSIIFNYLILISSNIENQKKKIETTQYFNQSEKEWNHEYKAGRWAFIDRVSIERSKHALIAGVFIQQYGDKVTVLDVGCGEGTLSDFLWPSQKKLYVGIDISFEAVRIGKAKRNLNFIQTSTDNYIPLQDIKFDVIVFNEMLYYVDHTKTMIKYSKFLSDNGIIIISCWYNEKVTYLRNSIFNSANSLFESVESIDISGNTIAFKKKHKIPVSFHIEAFSNKGKITPFNKKNNI
jgi:2-polyprenyl-3-methyl-5-hydroxy-6-metoxy-1,4-benzoquinol methylase